MHRLDDVQVRTATVSDLLSGTQLDPMPGNGFLRVYAASTVNTARITIAPNKHAPPTGAGDGAITLRANGEVRKYDPSWETEVVAGEKVTIGISGTTGTYYTWCSFIGA